MAMSQKTEYNQKRATDVPFNIFLSRVIHDWSRTLTALAFILVPCFSILDYFTMPRHLLPKFAIYRVIATLIPLLQYQIIKKTRPSKLSYVHGYIVTLVVGSVIAIMTIDIGGFDSRYYAGINLVIIGVNLLLPWEAVHSTINGIMIVAIYVILNLIFPHEYNKENLINNLFFMNATVIIAVSINYVRHRLLKQEFFLRSQLRMARDALWGEMELAKKIQTSILPTNESLGGYQISAIMDPAEEVGGDYYDFFETETGEQWVTIGDVSGHGVESGLIMMMTQTSILSILNRTRGLTPSEMLKNVNSVIRKNISRLDARRYMTLCAIKLCENKIITAGKHQDILILRDRDSSVEVFPTTGTWIGIADDLEEFMTDQEINISQGDMILLFTDGASEAMSPDEEPFGDERIIESFKKNSHKPLNDVVTNILNDMKSFQAGQHDDITLLVIKKLF